MKYCDSQITWAKSSAYKCSWVKWSEAKWGDARKCISLAQVEQVFTLKRISENKFANCIQKKGGELKILLKLFETLSIGLSIDACTTGCLLKGQIDEQDWYHGRCKSVHLPIAKLCIGKRIFINKTIEFVQTCTRLVAN